MNGPTEREYWAFISYSHDDKEVAQWLQRELERYPLGRKQRRGGLPKHLKPIFRDESELTAQPGLTKELEGALDRSKALIVLCSPSARRSKYTNGEIEYYRNKHGGDRIYCLLVDGEPNAADPELEAFPPAVLSSGGLSAVSEEPAPEPLAADVRPWTPDVEFGKQVRRARKSEQERRDKAKVMLVASLTGLGFDDLWDREKTRRRRRRIAWSVGSPTALIVSSFLLFWSWSWVIDSRIQDSVDAGAGTASSIQHALAAYRGWTRPNAAAARLVPRLATSVPPVEALRNAVRAHRESASFPLPLEADSVRHHRGARRLVTWGEAGMTLWRDSLGALKELDPIPVPGLRLLEFSEDGSRLVGVIGDDSVRLWDARDGTEVAGFREGGRVLWVGLDSGFLVTVLADGRINAWDAGPASRFSAPLWTESREEPLALVALGAAADSAGLVVTTSGTNDGWAAWVWELDTGRSVAEHLESREIRHVSVDRDGSRYAISTGSQLKIYDRAGDSVLLSGPRDLNPTWSEFSPDSRHVLSVWGTRIGVSESDRRGRGRFREHGGNVVASRFSPDGLTILTASDSIVKIWLDPFPAHATAEFPIDEVGVVKPPEPGAGSSGALSFGDFLGHDSDRIVTYGGTDSLRVWTWRAHRYATTIPSTGHSMVFATDGATLFTGGPEGDVQRWDAESGRLLETVRGPSGPDAVDELATSRTHLLASRSRSGVVRLWDCEEGCRPLKLGHQDAHAGVRAMAFDSAGERFATADSLVRVVQLRRVGPESASCFAGTSIGALQFGVGGLLAADAGPPPRLVDIHCEGESETLWEGDAETARRSSSPIRSIRIIPSQVSTDSRLIMILSADNAVWLLAGGDSVQMPNVGDIEATAVAQDGRAAAWTVNLAADSAVGGAVRRWDLNNGECLRPGYDERVCATDHFIPYASPNHVAFMPDGRLVTSDPVPSDADRNVIRRWSSNGRESVVLDTTSAAVEELLVSPTGDFLAVRDREYGVRLVVLSDSLLEARAEELLQRLLREAQR